MLCPVPSTTLMVPPYGALAPLRTLLTLSASCPIGVTWTFRVDGYLQVSEGRYNINPKGPSYTWGTAGRESKESPQGSQSSRWWNHQSSGGDRAEPTSWPELSGPCLTQGVSLPATMPGGGRSKLLGGESQLQIGVWRVWSCLLWPNWPFIA